MLTRVADINQYLQAVQQVKPGSQGLLTNFYASRDQVLGWISRQKFFVVEAEGAACFLRRDRDFYHLHHVAADTRALSRILALLPVAVPKRILATDLVGRGNEVAELSKLYENHGFRRYRSLIRMVRFTDGKPVRAEEDIDVVQAVAEDAPAVLAFLEGTLDRFVEQIPEIEELQSAAVRKEILVARRRREFAGVLVMRITGLSSTLRYWIVSGKFRNQGIGSRLIKRFFQICSGGKRVVLWVFPENEDAIGKYRHYGFAPDGLVDQVLINRRTGVA